MLNYLVDPSRLVSISRTTIYVVIDVSAVGHDQRPPLLNESQVAVSTCAVDLKARRDAVYPPLVSFLPMELECCTVRT